MVVAAVLPVPRGRSLAEAMEARCVWGPRGGFLSGQGRQDPSGSGVTECTWHS